MRTDGPGQEVFRNRETRLFASLAGVIPLLVVLTALFSEGPTSGRLAISVLAVGVGTWVVSKWMRAGIYADANGVEVRGITEKRVLWSQISRFQLRPGLSGVVAHVDLLDGSSIRASALNAGSGVLPSMERRAQDQIDALNELLVKARGSVPQLPPSLPRPKRLWEYPGFVIATQGPLAGLLLAIVEPRVRTLMIAYVVGSVVVGLGWLWKQKHDESR